MGRNQRERKRQMMHDPGRSTILGGGGNVEPPFCPFIAGVLGQPTSEHIVQPGVKAVTMQFQAVPIQCMGKTCMLWGEDEEGGFCMIVEAVAKILDAPEPENSGGNGGNSEPGPGGSELPEVPGLPPGSDAHA